MGFPSALSLIAGLFAAGLTPPEPIAPSAWAAQNLVVPDGEYAGRVFDLSLTPYLREPMDHFAAESDVNEFAVRKSAQTGFTLMALGAAGYSIDRDPCDMMVVQPTDAALADFASQKLTRAFEMSEALKAKLRPQVARSGQASKTYEKRFGHHALFLCIATSAADLSSKTIKKAILDEVDRYPVDIDNQGSPIDLVKGRQTMYLASGSWKRGYISTPTVKDASVIDALFLAGDQRYWRVKCPGCGELIRFEWNAPYDESSHGLKFKSTYPHQAYYVPRCCGVPIGALQKNLLVREAEASGGGWVAEAPGPGKYPSYHFDALSSPFVPWDEIAKAYVAAGDDPAKLQPFFNLVLGLAWEVKGDAPDHEKLAARREPYRRGHIPPRALMVTTAADVQLRGIYVETVGWAANRESWVIDADVLDGDTTDSRAGAFAKLGEWYDRAYPDAFGGARQADAVGVDSGFRTHVVYDWCRTRHRAYALDGRDGWTLPAVGLPKLKDVDLDGRRVAQGVKLWPVGTWPLKGNWYADLSLAGVAEGLHRDPDGYVHFGDFLDLSYFLQVTAEYLAERRVRGHVSKYWALRNEKTPNHWFDCRIYNMALADHLGLSRMTAEEWKVLARERASALLDQPELFAPRMVALQAAGDLARAVEAPAPAPEVERSPERPGDAEAEASGWLGGRDLSGWLRR